MKCLGVTAVATCLFIGLTALAADAPPAAGEATWLESWTKATEAAKAAKKPILVAFIGSDWCSDSKKLDKEVFSTKEFNDWAQKSVILLKLDFPHHTPQDAAIKKQNEDMAAKYKVKGYPTVLLLNAEGKQLGQGGYQDGGPVKWTASITKMLPK